VEDAVEGVEVRLIAHAPRCRPGLAAL
jgi:hypothetical protein